MPPPTTGLVRVFAHVNADKLRAGRWCDVPADRLEDYLSLGFAAQLDDQGNPPPVDVPQRCCSD